MSQVILNPGSGNDINADFADVKTIMKHKGIALMGIGKAKGDEATSRALDNAIIIKNLNSEAPIQKWNNINVPTLEKILVDIIADDELFAAQQGELEFIFKSAFDKYNINESKMKRYASRRNREAEIKNQTNRITAK